MIYHSHSPEETEDIARTLGKTAKSGDILAFSGDLGAGKTAFSRGFARGLGITESITSPTFTIVNEYLNGRLPLFHFDLYRLSGEEDLFDLGFEEYFQRNGVILLEWSEIAGDLLEDLEGNLIFVEIRVGKEENHREITIRNVLSKE